MADVEQRAEAEATAKGLSGQARKSYIGGVFNKIREAHARAIRPGQGKTFLSNLNRRNRQLARARYHEALRPHEEAVAALKQQRKHELGQLSYERSGAGASPAQLQQRILASDLKPIRQVEGVDIGQQMAQGPNPALLREVYGQQQLPQALDLFPTATLRKAARQHGVSASGSREALIGRLAAPKAPPTPTKPPRDAFPARDRQIRAAVKHGAPDFPPGVGQPPKPATAPARELTPVGHVDRALLDPYAPPNPHALRQLYGDAQLEAALARYSLGALKDAARAHGVNPQASNKRVLVKRLMAKAQEGAPDFPPGVGQPLKPATAPPQPTRDEIRAAKEKAEAETREYYNQQRRQNKKVRRERDEDRYQQNQLLNKHGYHWRMKRDPLHDDDADMPAYWQLLDPSGQPVTVDTAMRHIREGK